MQEVRAMLRKIGEWWWGDKEKGVVKGTEMGRK